MPVSEQGKKPNIILEENKIEQKHTLGITCLKICSKNPVSAA